MSLRALRKCFLKLVLCIHSPDIDNLTSKNLNMEEIAEREKIRDTKR